jgi:hypothetical protein
MNIVGGQHVKTFQQQPVPGGTSSRQGFHGSISRQGRHIRHRSVAAPSVAPYRQYSAVLSFMLSGE